MDLGRGTNKATHAITTENSSAQLGLGLEDKMDVKVGVSIRRSATGNGTFNVHYDSD